MALRKAMILVGAWLLVPTFQNRIKLDQENKFTLGKTEEMIQHANDRAMNQAAKRTHVTSPDSTMASTSRMNKAMKKKAKRYREELAEASTPQEVHKDQIGKVEDAADESVAALGSPFSDEDSSTKEAVAIAAAAGGVELARCDRQDDACLQGHWKAGMLRLSGVPSCAKAAVATGTSYYYKSYCETYTKEMSECCAKACVKQGLQEAVMMGCPPEVEAAVKRKQAQVPSAVTAQKKKGPASLPTSPSPDEMEATNGNDTSTEEQTEQELKAKRRRTKREKTKANKRTRILAAKGEDKDKAKDEGEDLGKDKGEEEGQSNVRFAFTDAVGLLGSKMTLASRRGDFVGFIYKEDPATKTLLIKSWQAFEAFGMRPEAVIPLGSNSGGAKVGDCITFDLEVVQEGQRKPQALAVNVVIRSRGYGAMLSYRGASGLSTITPLTFLRTGFFGLIYQEMPGTKSLLIACWEARDEFGIEAVIPQWSNPIRAKVGDRISFDVEHLVQEGEGKPRPMAINLFIRSRGDGTVVPKVQAPTDVCTQVLYYLSDENLRTDRFFQDIIATTEGGWISTDILLGCRRMQQLAASSKSIIKCLQNAPGVEVRDMLGQEAVRRTSPPPLLEGPVAAAIVAKQTAVVPALAKKIFTKKMMTLLGDLVMKEATTKMVKQDQGEFHWATRPEADEHAWSQWQRSQSAPAVAVEHGWGQWQRVQRHRREKAQRNGERALAKQINAPVVAEAEGLEAAIQG